MPHVLPGERPWLPHQLPCVSSHSCADMKTAVTCHTWRTGFRVAGVSSLFVPVAPSLNHSGTWAFTRLPRPYLQGEKPGPTASSPTSSLTHGLYFAAADLH